MLETPMPLPSFASRAPKTPSVAALATLTDLVGSALSVAIPASTSNHVRNAERSATMHLTNTAPGLDFKYNTRKVTDGERTVDAIRLIGGKRLMLKTPKAQGE